MSELLAGWIVCQAHGLTLIGKANGAVMSPVYEVKPNLAAGRNGLEIAHVIAPVWLLGVDEMQIPVGAIVEWCENFTPEQRKRLHQGCMAAAELQKQFQHEGLRVLLASPDVKLPPLVSK